MRKVLTAKAVEAAKPAPKGKRVEHFDGALPGFGLRVTETGSKSWIVFYRRQVDGKQRRMTIGSYPAL